MSFIKGKTIILGLQRITKHSLNSEGGKILPDIGFNFGLWGAKI